MINLISLLMFAGSGGSSLKANDVLFCSEKQLLSVVGKRDPAAKREFGLALLHPGYTKVWVDTAGPAMKQAHFCLARYSDWKSFLLELGLSGKHATSIPMSVPVSPVPLLRNRIQLNGVTGLPRNKDHVAWKVSFVEYAIANKAKLRGLKSQITAASVGEARLRLIRSCYDWYSEIDVSK